MHRVKIFTRKFIAEGYININTDLLKYLNMHNKVYIQNISYEIFKDKILKLENDKQEKILKSQDIVFMCKE